MQRSANELLFTQSRGCPASSLPPHTQCPSLLSRSSRRVQAWTTPAGLGGVQINAALFQSTSCFSTYLSSATYAASKAVDGVLQVLSAAETFYNSQGNGPQEFWQVVRSPHPRSCARRRG